MLENSGPVSAFKIIVLYAGAVIGAGFASGQEILQFFIVFGDRGLWGLLLAAILFCYLGGLVMFLAVSLRTSSYKDLYRAVLGRLPGRIMDGLSLVMLPGGIVVMLAGGGSVFSEYLGTSRILGTVFTALITAAVISKGLKGVTSASALLVPLKMAAIIVISLLVLLVFPEGAASRAVTADHGSGVNWAWSAVLYVSYNMVVPVAVLSSLGKSASCRTGVWGGVLGGAVLGAVAGVMVVAGLRFYPQITGYEIPLLFMAGSLGSAAKAVLGPLIWVAILTTAIADTHGFACRFAESRSKRYKAFGFGALILALPLSTLKFSLLVKVLYPLFGYAGLILMAALLFIPPARIIRRRFFRTV
ncbi:MAG: hypothetical protein K6T65_05850 [Peptococcaceae bacterium]|nr:hypothetical protein [Peptococcaceae bacterium]